MKPYSKEALCSALEEVRQQTLSIRAAAKKNSVPVTTLHNRVSGRITMGAKWGKTTLLPLAKEKELINYALQRAEMGIGFSKETFLRFAGQFAKSEGVTFKNSVASEKWWLGLKQRNPEFSLRTAEPTALGRHMSITRLRISRYFSQLISVLVENSLLDKSPFIWNMDETGLSLSPKCPKVLARKGSKVVHAKSSSPRELVTIIACGNASGYVIPPHAFIPGKTVRALRSYGTENAPEGTKLSVSDSGWTKQGISELWSVFEALKSSWSDHLHRFTSTTGVTVGHAQFFRMFKLAWTESMIAENVASGFLATGICPYNPGAVPDLAYAPPELYTARVL
ncbi:uncharacterized protein LOC128549707 [Mercenaria mercenaria]|uniref:uncharacterized protein LOC128549707 n=1 Tax=Mercenaria mercenaria TaxID=6596 RepID=UPI00234F56CA|nr:uncharacterized protein LOC128549707 [Mercenaria mercenaria]